MAIADSVSVVSESTLSDDILFIRGGRPLSGLVRVSGGKNAVLPIMTACLLTDDLVELSDVPHLTDVACLSRLLEQAGVTVVPSTHPETKLSGNISLQLFPDRPRCSSSCIRLGDESRQMRASVLLMGPLLARGCRVELPLPGGDPLGERPVNYHLQAMRQMGANVVIHGGTIIGEAFDGLHGTQMTLPFPSVGATENIMMAATLACGRTIIHNAAQEPEIIELAIFLRTLGARIDIHRDTITIDGVSGSLHSPTPPKHRIRPDRIETISYIVLSALCGGSITIAGCDPDFLGQDLTSALRSAGVKLSASRLNDDPHLYRYHVDVADSLSAIEICTGPFPQIATDVQAHLCVLLCSARGMSRVRETVFDKRFDHIWGLNQLGCNIRIDGQDALIYGPTRFDRGNVMARDIRSSFALLVATLLADGVSRISGLRHLHRGYAHLQSKIRALGADLSVA